MGDDTRGSARQLERVRAIDRFLRTGKCPTAAWMALELGVSERTVFRDIVFLRDRLGAPVAYDLKKRGYRYTRRHRFLPSLSLSQQDLLALMLMARLSRFFLGPTFADRVRRTVEKVLEAAGERL